MQDLVMPQSPLPLNETLLKEMELTSSDIQDFVKRLFDFQKKNQSQLDECQGYCQGDIYKWLGAYNGIHGYVSLLVSIIQPSPDCQGLPSGSLISKCFKMAVRVTVLIILMSSCHKARHFSFWLPDGQAKGEGTKGQGNEVDSGNK